MHSLTHHADVGVGGFDELLNLSGEVSTHFCGTDGAHRTQRKADHVLRLMVEVILEGVGDEEVDVLSFVKEEHRAEIADALIGEPRRRDQLQAFQLSKMRRIAAVATLSYAITLHTCIIYLKVYCLILWYLLGKS